MLSVRDPLFAFYAALSGDPLMGRRAEQLHATGVNRSRFHNLIDRIMQDLCDPIKRKSLKRRATFAGIHKTIEHLLNNDKGNCTGHVAKWTQKVDDYAREKDELIRQHATFWFKAQRRYADDMERDLEEHWRRLRLKSEAWVYGDLEARNRQISLPIVEAIVDEPLDTIYYTDEDSS